MTALAPSTVALAGPSQPPSQSSSPASPTAGFSAAQQAAVKSVQSHFRSAGGSSRPSTPVGGNTINGNNSNGNGNGSTNSNGSSGSAGPPLEPPPGMSYTEFLKTWGDAHVARWLAALDPHGKCAAHAHAFRDADVRGSVLLDLDQASLREIGVASIGDRIRILNAVKALRMRCSARAASAYGGHAQGASISSITSSNGSGGHAAHQSPKVTVNGAEHVDFPRTLSPQNQHAHHAARNRMRPAPLQLRNASQADLPRLIRDPVSVPDSARSTTPLRPLPLPNNQNPSSATTTPLPTVSSHSSSGSGSGRQHLPPLPPPPRTMPPLPPSGGTPSRSQAPRLHAIATQQAAGRRTPTQIDASPNYALPAVPGVSQAQNQNQPPTQTPTLAQNSMLLTPGASTAGSNASTPGGWKGEYGLPSGPRPGNAVSRATSPLPNYGRRSPANSHAKAPSFSATASASQVKNVTRPSTSGGHPYATAGASSAASSSDSRAGAGGGVSTLQPPQSGLALVLSPIAESFISQSLATPTISPPNAGTSSSSTPLSGPASAGSSNTGSGSGSGSSAPASAYHVGRGPFRPATPSSAHPGAPTLVDLRRRLVRFLLAEDGHSAMVDVADCPNGVELLERVLKKFGKLGASAGDTYEHVSSDEGGLSIDGWAVYLDWGQGQEDGPAKALREAELLSLCSVGPDHPVREHGLTVRRTGKPRRQKALQQIFGDVPLNSPHSPGTAAADEDGAHFGSSSVMFPRALTPSQEKELRNMKRASSISVLSGLGVRDPERVLDPTSLSAERDWDNRDRDRSTDRDKELHTSAANGKSPSASSFAGKIRTFLGQRPPSELIATHLPAYFPYTQPKVLRRTVRQSMRFSSVAGRRDSAISVSQLSKRASRRVSTATRASASPYRMSTASLPPPPVPEKGASPVEEPPRMSLSTSDGQSIDIGSDEEERDKPSTPHLLPPVTFPSESFADSFHSVTGTGASNTTAPGAASTAGAATPGARSGPTPTISRTASNASRRISYMSELRARRDRSDTASMLTVDEITAEVENRRKSTVVSVKSTESGDVPDGSVVTEEPNELDEDSENFEMIEGEDEIDEEEEDELEDEEDEEDDDMEEDDDGVTLADEDDDAPVKATGGKRGTKWIRGALIGAGSFGSVYLGMDAMNGLLMAVKQVELPTGTGPNEQRKKSMLDALEREIDLLRELQHDNIVQYLDSSSDDTHLNIFLEYVPGGSVTALLRSYGAFEEALCRHFVRQILQGLDYLHSRDIIHRDIKGANILVDNKGGIKISDFGISKKVEETFLGSGARVHRPSLQGSVFWMAPEVVKQVTHTRKADIWSVGCLVVEMLTGNHPYPTLNQMQAIFKIGSSAKPTIPSDISPEAEDFLQKTFEIKHEERPDADQLLLHPWIVKGPSAAPASTSKPASTKTKTTKSS